jgi:hypothetical protein
MTPLSRRRAALIVAAVAAVVVGLTVHENVDSSGGAFAGDAIYAALIFAIVGALVPRAPSAVAGGIAFTVCALIEVLQLTGVPARISATIPGAELVLGSTFQWTDLLAYALGASLAVLADRLTRCPALSPRIPRPGHAGTRRAMQDAGQPDPVSRSRVLR